MSWYWLSSARQGCRKIGAAAVAIKRATVAATRPRSAVYGDPRVSGEKAHWLLRAGKEEQRLPLKPKDPCKLGTDRGRDGDKEEEEMVDGEGGGRGVGGGGGGWGHGPSEGNEGNADIKPSYYQNQQTRELISARKT